MQQVCRLFWILFGHWHRCRRYCQKRSPWGCIGWPCNKYVLHSFALDVARAWHNAYCQSFRGRVGLYWPMTGKCIWNHLWSMNCTLILLLALVQLEFACITGNFKFTEVQFSSTPLFLVRCIVNLLSPYGSYSNYLINSHLLWDQPCHSG